MNAWRTGFRNYRGNSVLRYGLTNLLPRSVAILSTLLLTPLAIKQLGVLDYGIWALATLIPTLVSSPDFGITYGVVNEMAQVQQQHGHLRSERERLLGLMRLLMLIAMGWLVVGSLGLAWYVFGSPPTSGIDPTLMYVALVLALGIFTLGIPPSLWGRAQLAQERGHQFVAWEGVGKVGSFVASLLTLLFAPDLLLLVAATLLPAVIAAYVNAWKYVHSALGEMIEPRWSLARVMRDNQKIFSAGRYFFVFQLTFLIGTAIDPFLVNKLLSTREVAYLTVARRPFDALPLAVTLFSTALWPVFNRMNAGNQVMALKRMLGWLTFGSAALLAVLSGLIIVFSEPLYGYLSQGRLSIQREDLFWVALQTMSLTVILVFNNYMNAVNLLRSQMWVQIVAAFLGLVAKFLGLRYGGIHLYFVAASTVYFLSALVPMAWLTLSHIRRREREHRQVA